MGPARIGYNLASGEGIFPACVGVGQNAAMSEERERRILEAWREAAEPWTRALLRECGLGPVTVDEPPSPDTGAPVSLLLTGGGLDSGQYPTNRSGQPSTPGPQNLYRKPRPAKLDAV